MNPVVILCRNGCQQTTEAIESLLHQTIPIELYAVNNGSSDNTAPFLNSLYAIHRNIHILHNYPGRGVAASWNQMLRSLFVEHEHVLVGNNDIIARPDTYESLLAHGGPFVTAVGVRGDHYGETRDGLKVFRDNLGAEIFPGGPVDLTSTRPHPDFSLFMIRKSVWETVGEFDEGFKGAYAEDADYHVRMHRAGIEAVCIDLPFYHIGAGTIKAVSTGDAESIIERANDNREYFKSKYGCEVGSTEYYHDRFGSDAPEDSKFVTKGDQ